ncbi:MAG: hypothetical protein II692_00965, partial [Paludibacteraceae bacterium]|nr:hypothetical protein [Paludibacteraceae bacterium]
MKKSLLLMLFLALTWSWTAKAETLIFDFEDGQIPSEWTNDATYPWVAVTTDPASTAGHYIKSSNEGVGSSTSSISASFNFVGDGSISFDGGCWGEGTSTAWDKCIFEIDGVQQFAKGEANPRWEN